MYAQVTADATSCHRRDRICPSVANTMIHAVTSAPAGMMSSNVHAERAAAAQSITHPAARTASAEAHVRIIQGNRIAREKNWAASMTRTA